MSTVLAPQPFISVVIPTYNRKDSLLRTLDSLNQQTYPVERFEVIVVDDGGSDGTQEVAGLSYRFLLRYVWQQNQGDALARNRGALEAQGDVLQFLDDDILVEPGFLAAIAREHSHNDRAIVIGQLLPLASSSPTAFEQVTAAIPHGRDSLSDALDFTEVLSGVLSVGRKHYLALGMMQPVARSGSSVWCDVEFAYRAQAQGFTFRQSVDAIGHHDDYAARDLNVLCRRYQRAASVGADLFRRHPGLQAHIPMFRDKGPIAWRQDNPTLIARKLARQVLSSPPVLRSMEGLVQVLEARHAPPATLERLYRWIVGAYIYHGYREGLRLRQKAVQ